MDCCTDFTVGVVRKSCVGASKVPQDEPAMTTTMAALHSLGLLRPKILGTRPPYATLTLVYAAPSHNIAENNIIAHCRHWRSVRGA